MMNIVYNNQVKLSSLQIVTIDLFIAVVNDGKLKKNLVARNPYFSQVVSGGVNFIVEKRKKRLYYDQVKLRSIQSFCLWKLLMLAFFFIS